ncbi:MAG: CDP-glycerol glycerophosphotransferase family protein, partial [Rubripirellula sp.]|nr:CDP-glycerol glycerophosphotransferase family protein [Rubripirellula sp.]
MSKTILVADRPISSIPPEIRDSLENDDVHVLNFAGTWSDLGVPDVWNRCQPLDESDESELREAVLGFLEDWPKRKVRGNLCFDDMFRRLDGYSVWWTSVGASRTASSPLICALKRLWILNKNIQALSPERIVVHLDTPSLVEVIQNRFCESESVRVDSTFGCSPAARAFAGWPWLCMQFAKLPFTFLKFMVLWLVVRIACPQFKSSDTAANSLAVVFKPKLVLARNIEVTAENVSLPYWDSLIDWFRQNCEKVRPRYILDYRAKGQSPWTVIRWLRGDCRYLFSKLEGAARPVNAYCGVFDWLRALPMQLWAYVNFFALVRNHQLRQTMHFLGFDLSAVLAPLIQRNVEGLAAWERSLGQLTACCSTIPNAKLVCMLGEFYPGPMQLIAAAKRLGIPVLGAQHGTICPDHYVYTVPLGHMKGAPTPDYFAVYGEYSEWVVSGLGHYPQGRTRVTGVPRLDALVNKKREKERERARLGFPEGSKVILISAHTTRNFPWFVEVVKAACAAALEGDDWMVCIKYHPGETSHSLYEDAVRSSGNQDVRFFREDFDGLLTACDVLISGSSTTILEAALLRRPAISADFTGGQERYPYISDGAALPARDSRELRDSLNVILNDSESCDYQQGAEEFLRRHVG